jgi:hypothetical protein
VKRSDPEGRSSQNLCVLNHARISRHIASALSADGNREDLNEHTF